VDNKNAIYYIFTDSVIDFVIDKALHYHVESLRYHQKITAKNFMNAWLSFFKDKLLETKYESNPEWTEFILGKERGNIEIAKVKGSFYEHLQNELGVDLKPYREDKFCDVSIYGKEEFSNVFSMHEKNRKDIVKDKQWYKDCLITLEHENNYLLSSSEMMYLTYRRSRLKVLITYSDDDDDDTLKKTKKVFNDLCKNFSTIIRQSNIHFQENEKTEYLLIVGNKVCKAEFPKYNKLIWNTQAFNWSGQWT
jgi:hypothetical protein